MLVVIALIVASPVGAHTSKVGQLHAREHRVVRKVEQAKTTIKWFEKRYHGKTIRWLQEHPDALRAVNVARQRVIFGRAELGRIRALIRKHTYRPRSVYEQARDEAYRLGVSPAEWAGCIVPIVNHENDSAPPTWDTTKDYGGGHGNVYEAYGLPQANPGTKMASAGPKWRDDAATQMRWMVGYVERFGGPCGAWAHWQAHSSY